MLMHWSFQTIPDITPCMVSNEDPRQHNHRDNAKTRRNIGHNASQWVQLLAFSLFNWSIDNAEAVINRGGIIFPIAEGVGEGEDWINNSVPNPTLPVHILCTSSLIHRSWRRLASKWLCWLDTDRGERESGDWQTKIFKLGLDLKLRSNKKMRTQSLISALLFDCIGQATSPRNQLESSSKNPQTHPRHHLPDCWRSRGSGELN